jgi:tyrosyl-tRNA synthetase
VCGVELGRRIEGRTLFGLTSPLITLASGAKMGKTADGAVWLNADRLTPYDYWQFWRNTEDADVGRFLRLFTDLPLDEIARLETAKDAEINQAKIVLANEATALLHGREAASTSASTAYSVFVIGGVGESLPIFEAARTELEKGMPLIGLLQKAGLAASFGEARRLVRGNGVRVNDQTVTDEMRKLGLGDINGDGVIKLSVGRKRHALVKPI